MMRRLMIALAVFILAQGVAMGQSTGERKGLGYIFAGVGGASNNGSEVLINAGGGGEGLVYKGLGLGGEIGYVSAIDSEGAGLASGNISYHFNRSQKLSPFITGGPSVGFRGGASAGGGNIGGGVHYWAGDRVGVRFEFRNFIFSSDSPHTYVFRVGISFR